MLDFFQIDSTFVYSKTMSTLMRIGKHRALSFYLLAMSKIALGDGKATKADLENFCRWGIPLDVIHRILEDTGLFYHDDDHYYYVNEEVQNGLWNNQINSTRVHGRPHARPRARQRERPQAGPQASPQAGPQEGTCAGPIPSPEGNIEIEIEIEIESETRAEESFYRFIAERCPHLQLMSEPMLYEQARELTQTYGGEALRSVLLDMENKTDLQGRSAYLTARSWLERRGVGLPPRPSPLKRGRE